MERLPDELVAYVFDYVQAAHALSTAMVVNRQWYMYGARNLHARLTLALGFDMTLESEDVVMSLTKRLVSPDLSTAHLLRHLVVHGLVRADVHNLLLDILRHATGLRSLDIHSLRLLQADGSFFPPDAFSCPDFLPNLVALNVGSAPYLACLVRTRQLRALRVHDPIDHALLRRITDPSSKLSGGIHCLELVISAGNTAAMIEQVAYLASALEHAPLYAMGLQIVFPQPGLVSWPDFEDTIGQMGPFLRLLGNLSVFGLVVRPDPIISTSTSAELGSGDQQREIMTRALAERLIADNGLSKLKRIDLRWHGWRVQEGQLEAVLRPELLRLPQNWLYKQLGVDFP